MHRTYLELSRSSFALSGEECCLVGFDATGSDLSRSLSRRTSKEEVAKTCLSCVKLNDTTFCLPPGSFCLQGPAMS